MPIQVHPDKQAARELFNSSYGKTEAWYILDGREIDGVEPYILLGFKENVTYEMLKELFDKQDIKGMEALMHRIPVKAGDVYLIEGGTPHAIGSGCFLLEIQEPTDYTISLEKCNTLGEKLPDFLCHQGLGFEKMFDCFNYIKYSLEDLKKEFKLKPLNVDKNITQLISYERTPCFSLNKICVTDSLQIKSKGRATALVVVGGEGRVDDVEVKCGDCLFVPAAVRDFIIEKHGTEDLIILECLPPC